MTKSLIWRRLICHCAVERQLKDSLLCEAADLFAKGEREFCQFTRKPMSTTISLIDGIAELYRKIDRKDRAFLYYYLVAFYGDGFASYLNGISFVFRSDKLEKHADFMKRMQQV
ncbi:unnamed protein product [Cylicocyclus nassatus]|uniref:DOCKER domain-containing protein n=1 Tax=Cylicocyclus nassatus TaxID=53992 RepID=A0AA36DLY0_CYLNA|nr:unnamed protein product [Cylicocyclus nassatus]